MTKKEFLCVIDDILEEPEGTVRGDERLEDLTWDSLAVVSYIATVNAFFDVTLAANDVKNCESIGDLLTLVSAHIEP